MLAVVFVMVFMQGLTAFPTTCRTAKYGPGVKVTCHDKHLRQFPRGIPNNTVYLDIQKTGIWQIKSKSLEGLHHLRVLNLANNKIKEIEPIVFALLPNLEAFNLSNNPFPHNRLNPDILCQLNKTKIISLAFHDFNFTKNFTSFFFDCLPKNLQYLDLSYNDIGPLPNYMFVKFGELQVLRLSQTTLEPFNPLALANLTELDTLELKSNKLTSFPKFSYEDGSAMLPKIRSLFMSYNMITHISPRIFNSINTLEDLTITFNPLRTLEKNQFYTLPKIRYINLMRTYVSDIDEYTFNSTSLKFLDLRDIMFKFSGLKSSRIFYHCTQLKQLMLDNWNFELKYNRPHEHIFSMLPNLERLSLFKCKIKYIPPVLFSNLHKLLKLRLSKNSISEWEPAVFQNLFSLQNLYLASNEITVINMTSFPDHFAQHLLKLDMADNPFACTCELLWFRRWMNSTNVTLLGIKEQNAYTCSFPQERKGQSLLLFNPSQNDCVVVVTHIGLILGVALSFIVVFVLLIVTLLYKYRWHLRYIYFYSRARLRRYHAMEEDVEYIYDAFIVYNSMEVAWLRENLIPELENESGYRLCLHERDWLPGPDIVDNIVYSIENSRKVILLVSNAFAKSQWCQLELTMAQTRVFDKDKRNLILILLENIDPENMTPRLALQMRKRSYIEWTENAMGQRLFWMKLKQSMEKPPGSFMQETGL